jgi:hypothetical protein
MLGGGLVTDISRRILLGEEVKSGRYYFDIDQWFKAGPIASNI